MFESIANAMIKAIKYLIFLFNFVFVLLGIALITIGVILRSSTGKYLPIFEKYPNYTTAPDLIIFLGVIVFFIAFIGCCGALRENHCMIFTFGVLMVAILIAGIVLGVAGYKMKAEAGTALQQGLNYSMYRYNTSQEDTAAWDEIQTDLNCCGINSARDWLPVYKNGSVPRSCCTDEAVCNQLSPKLRKTPCLSALTTIIQDNSATIVITGLVLAAIQVLGIVFACCLSCKFRNNYESV